ncbi:interferon-induced protein with tetratricopeptide repeats 5 [Puma concolor]|uniref:Interferon-induced protein with tetratricopeptide repeats 5 n=1 Tax=Puma concolor TaxID=9696 RepID=A0A6P6HCV5_PUMCO|nr:interferon-induced protein with tetratricopeptide repeats 5 [Puma concolor]
MMMFALSIMVSVGIGNLREAFCSTHSPKDSWEGYINIRHKDEAAPARPWGVKCQRSRRGVPPQPQTRRLPSTADARLPLANPKLPCPVALDPRERKDSVIREAPPRRRCTLGERFTDLEARLWAIVRAVSDRSCVYSSKGLLPVGRQSFGPYKVLAGTILAIFAHLVSFSRSGPAFNKAHAWAATSRRRRPAGSARRPPALPAHAHTPARARPAARQLGSPVLRRKPEGTAAPLPPPGRPAAPSHHERSGTALPGAEPLAPCSRASCSERSPRALSRSRASGVGPGGEGDRARFPGAPTLQGVRGQDCRVEEPGDAPREPVPSLRLFSAAATAVLGCRPPPGRSRAASTWHASPEARRLPPLPGTAAAIPPEVDRRGLAAALQLSPRSTTAILPFRFWVLVMLIAYTSGLDVPEVASIEIPKDSLKALLLELECHFTWNLLKEDIDLFDVEDTIGQQLEFLTTKSRLTLYNLLAYVKHLKGQNQDALECLEQAEEIIRREHSDKEEIRSLVTWGNYAWVYYHMDQLKEAQKYIDKIANVCKKLSSPSNYKLERPEIDCEKGWALLKFGGKYYQKAKAAFEKALEVEPDNPEFNIGYAITVYRLDDSDREGSIKSFSLGPLRKAVTLNPDNSYIKVFLALKLQDVHAEAEGERYIEEILDQISSQPYVLRYAAKFYRRKNSWDKALELLKKALEVTPTSSFLHHQMGLCYRAQMIQIKKATRNRPKGKDKLKVDELITSAISHFKAAVERDSMFAFAYTDLANMYAEGGQYSNAEDIFQKALRLENITDDHKHQIHYHYGRFQEFHRKSESTAIHHYLEALKVKDRSSLRTKLTSALKKLAIKRLGYNASDVQSLSALGFVYKLEGEKRQAAEYYERAQKVDPENAEFITALCELRLSI